LICSPRSTAGGRERKEGRKEGSLPQLPVFLTGESPSLVSLTAPRPPPTLRYLLTTSRVPLVAGKPDPGLSLKLRSPSVMHALLPSLIVSLQRARVRVCEYYVDGARHVLCDEGVAIESDLNIHDGSNERMATGGGWYAIQSQGLLGCVYFIV